MAAPVTQVDFWILDFSAAIDATAGILDGDFTEDTWETTVWHKDDQLGWVGAPGYEVWKYLDTTCPPDFMTVWRVCRIFGLTFIDWLNVSYRRNSWLLEKQKYLTSGLIISVPSSSR
jgi:hypothetical protein